MSQLIMLLHLLLSDYCLSGESPDNATPKFERYPNTSVAYPLNVTPQNRFQCFHLRL